MIENNKKKIYIPRCIAETSFPFVIHKIKEYFSNIESINIICRFSEKDLFETLPGVDSTHIINTVNFEKKTLIKKFNKSDVKDITIIPIANIKLIHSYDNVLFFMKSYFPKNNIYYYCFDTNKIFKYEFNLMMYLFKNLIFFVSFLISLPFFLFYILILVFKIFIKKN